MTQPSSVNTTSYLSSSSRSMCVLLIQSMHSLASSIPAVTHRSSSSSRTRWRSQVSRPHRSHSPVTGPSHHAHSIRPVSDVLTFSPTTFLLGHPATFLSRYHVHRKEEGKTGHLPCGKHPWPVPAPWPLPPSSVSPIRASSSAENSRRSQCHWKYWIAKTPLT